MYLTQDRNGDWCAVVENAFWMLGPDVLEEETGTEVIVKKFDPDSQGYIIKERLAKVVDDPATPDVDEEKTFWQRVLDRLAFWRNT